MTNKIIIDGVDVAECQYLYFAIKDSIIDYKEYPRCSIGEAFTNNACKNSNCYYKQLKHKEKECEELKAKFQDMKKSRDIALKEYNEEFEYKRQITVEHLEQQKQLGVNNDR